MKKTVFIFAAVLISVTAKSQSVTIQDASIERSGAGPNFNATYYVILSDTNNVSQIEVKLGTDNGASDILSNTFDYDVTTGLPSGFSYQRIGNKLILSVGTIGDSNTIFGSVRVKDTSANWSSAYQFVTN